jgi:membrane protein
MNRTGLHPGALDDQKGQEVPSGPMHLSRASWLAAARRTVHEFGDDVLTDRAAALTYYAVLSIFPALLVLVSLLGLIGKSATQPMITNLSQAAPGAVRQIILQAINNLQKGHTTAGALAVVSLAGALWSASSYVAAFRRASNVIYDVPEGRPELGGSGAGQGLLLRVAQATTTHTGTDDGHFAGNPRT